MCDRSVCHCRLGTYQVGTCRSQYVYCVHAPSLPPGPWLHAGEAPDRSYRQHACISHIKCRYVCESVCCAHERQTQQRMHSTPSHRVPRPSAVPRPPTTPAGPQVTSCSARRGGTWKLGGGGGSKRRRAHATPCSASLKMSAKTETYFNNMVPTKKTWYLLENMVPTGKHGTYLPRCLPIDQR